MNRTERIAEQERAAAEDLAHSRPAERPQTARRKDPRGPHYWPCPARLGQRHNISMRRPGGGPLACWYCCRTSQQLRDAQQSEAA